MAAKASGESIFNATMPQMIALLRDPAFRFQLDLALESENGMQSAVYFRFEHGISLSSWGEVIAITLTPYSEAQVKVEILSKCSYPLQLVDWGKNKKNVNAIMQYIGTIFKRYEPPRASLHAGSGKCIGDK